VGQVATQVEVPITYNGATDRSPAAAPEATAAASVTKTAAADKAEQARVKSVHRRGFFGSIGHFFARMFGRK